MPSWVRHISVLSTVCFLCRISALSVSSRNKLPADCLLRVQDAMQLSKLSASNITSAQLACREWQAVFHKYNIIDDRRIAGICYALYASCLVRVGKDEEAINVYDSALTFGDVLDSQSYEKLILGKAQALQRCLEYDDALQQFLLSKCEQGVLGAATCALRLKRPKTAKETLSAFCAQDPSRSFCEAAGMLGALEFVDTGSMEPAATLLECAGSIPLYRWIGHVVTKSTETSNYEPKQNSFLQLIKINLCPFDDPDLLILDDKILLHGLLTSKKATSASFWPEGYVVSGLEMKSQAIPPQDPLSLWFSKLRSGYGSHGNQVLRFEDAANQATVEPRLLQRMVEPPLLFEGHKFSLRIYVVYFHPQDFYISTLGLVKLASAPATSNSTLDPRVHMTNSGRESAMRQTDLKYVSSALHSAGHSYDKFWNDIKQVVKEVFGIYFERVCESGTKARKVSTQEIGLPKIMGFDFVVDESVHPWLVEANRFPGLEPRDSVDATVKQKVVCDAWVKAGERLGFDSNPLQYLIDDIPCNQGPSTLEDIN